MWFRGLQTGFTPTPNKPPPPLHRFNPHRVLSPPDRQSCLIGRLIEDSIKAAAASTLTNSWSIWTAGDLIGAMKLLMEQSPTSFTCTESYKTLASRNGVLNLNLKSPISSEKRWFEWVFFYVPVERGGFTTEGWFSVCIHTDWQTFSCRCWLTLSSSRCWRSHIQRWMWLNRSCDLLSARQLSEQMASPSVWSPGTLTSCFDCVHVLRWRSPSSAVLAAASSAVTHLL